MKWKKPNCSKQMHELIYFKSQMLNVKAATKLKKKVSHDHFQSVPADGFINVFHIVQLDDQPFHIFHVCFDSNYLYDC